jgi:hypothetical protein
MRHKRGRILRPTPNGNLMLITHPFDYSLWRCWAGVGRGGILCLHNPSLLKRKHKIPLISYGVVIGIEFLPFLRNWHNISTFFQGGYIRCHPKALRKFFFMYWWINWVKRKLCCTSGRATLRLTRGVSITLGACHLHF